MTRLLLQVTCLIVLSSLLCQVNCKEEEGEKARKISVVLKYKSNATLDCSKFEDAEFYQKKEGANETTKLKGDEKNVEIMKGKLTLKDIRGEEIKSEYSCRKNDEIVREFENKISPAIFKPEKASQTISEGSRVEFKCVLLYGDNDDLKWTWKKNGTEIVEDERIKITTNEGKNESALAITRVNENDKGDYECELSNKHGEYSEKLFLRVKDKLAALWPFLGIVGEVVILCVVLLIFEKKCSKKRNNAEEDNEQTHNLMGKEGGETKKRIVKA